jgi:phosphatidylglycerol---prolipoprotein diacylglyceryl transferase
MSAQATTARPGHAQRQGGSAGGRLANGDRTRSPAGTAKTVNARPVSQVVPSPATSGEADAAGRGWLASAQQETLTATSWFDPGQHGEPYPVTIRFSGHRAGVTGRPQSRDSFAQVETVDGVVPGSGPVAITTRVSGVNPGEWRVTARPITRDGRSGPIRPCHAPPDRHATAARRGVWPWRAAPAAPGMMVQTTTLAPFAKVPGVVRFGWAALVALGMGAGLGVQALLLAHAHRQVGAAVLVSLLAVGAGVAGAKAWYVAVHRGRRFDGWCIQGFVAGAGLIAATLPLAVLTMPAGTFLDTAAGGLFLGMSVGRPGCFLAGCCTGRPTASRWGIWSSDRRVGVRRIPTQLLEAFLCLAIGVTALLLIPQGTVHRPGAVFVGAVSAYTLGRQFLLPLRSEPRATWIGRPLALSVSALALSASIVISALA